jgi:hypothetical protein
MVKTKRAAEPCPDRSSCPTSPLVREINSRNVVTISERPLYIRHHLFEVTSGSHTYSYFHEFNKGIFNRYQQPRTRSSTLVGAVEDDRLDDSGHIRRKGIMSEKGCERESTSVIGQFSFRCFIGFYRFSPFSQFPET